MERFNSRDYTSEVDAILEGMEADLARSSDRGGNSQLSGLKAKRDEARAKFADCERELVAAEAEQSDPAALDKALKAIAADAADRGDIAGAILAMSLNPKRAGEA
jgi:hypothetical protein